MRVTRGQLRQIIREAVRQSHLYERAAGPMMVPVTPGDALANIAARALGVPVESLMVVDGGRVDGFIPMVHRASPFDTGSETGTMLSGMLDGARAVSMDAMGQRLIYVTDEMT